MTDETDDAERALRDQWGVAKGKRPQGGRITGHAPTGCEDRRKLSLARAKGHAMRKPVTLATNAKDFGKDTPK